MRASIIFNSCSGRCISHCPTNWWAFMFNIMLYVLSFTSGRLQIAFTQPLSTPNSRQKLSFGGNLGNYYSSTLKFCASLHSIVYISTKNGNWLLLSAANRTNIFILPSSAHYISGYYRVVATFKWYMGVQKSCTCTFIIIIIA